MAMKTLKIGDKGKDVKELQQMLNAVRKKNGEPPIEVDGIYGKETAGAVRSWQARNANQVPIHGADSMVRDETGPGIRGDAGTYGAPVGAVEAGPMLAPPGAEEMLAANPPPPDGMHEGEAEARAVMEANRSRNNVPNLGTRSRLPVGLLSGLTNEMPQGPVGMLSDPEGYGVLNSPGPGMMDMSGVASMTGQTSDAIDPMQMAIDRRRAELASYQHANSPMAGGDMDYLPEGEPDPNGRFAQSGLPFEPGSGPDFGMADTASPDDNSLALILALKGLVKRKQMMEAERRNIGR